MKTRQVILVEILDPQDLMDAREVAVHVKAEQATIIQWSSDYGFIRQEEVRA